MNMRSMVKHGYIQTGGSTITADNVSQNNEYKVYKGEFKIGDEILNLKRDNLAIKIDVEGHEDAVLAGGERILGISGIQLAICTYHKKNDDVKYYKFFKEKNFELEYSQRHMLTN